MTSWTKMAFYFAVLSALSACGTPAASSTEPDDDVATVDAALSGDAGADAGAGTDVTAGTDAVAGTDADQGTDAAADADAGPSEDAAPDTVAVDAAADVTPDAGPAADAVDDAVAPDAGDDAGTDAVDDAATDFEVAADADDAVAGTDALDDAASDVALDDAFVDPDIAAADVDDALAAADDAADATLAADVSTTVAAPALAALGLKGMTLVAPFSPDVHDYAAYCSAGANAWTVLASGATETSIAVVAPVAVAFDLAGTATLTVYEHEAVVVRATAADGTNVDYWVRCLPHDFPKLSMTTATPPAPGYYVLGNTSVAPGESGYAMVLNQDGTPVWYQTTKKGACLTKWLAPNVLGFSPTLGAAFGSDPLGHYTVVDLATGVTTSVATAGMPTDQHELMPLSEGGYMLLSYPQVGGYDLTSKGLTQTTIVDCVIQELDQNGAVAWQWTGSEHMDPLLESSEFAPSTVASTPVIDAFHCNSVAKLPDGDVLLSVRHLDALLLISHQTGEILWKLGGTEANKENAPHISLVDDTEGGFHHQHHARYLSNGHITIFDNHSNQSTGVARGLEMAVDPTAATATVVAEYDGPAISAAMGDFQTLWDGTHLVGWGALSMAKPKPVFSEFDLFGNIVRQFFFTNGDAAYRVMKVPVDALDINLLRSWTGKIGL
jgi:hypothetical protein